MFTSLSPEVRVPILMRDIGVSIAYVSVLTGIEKTKLSHAFRQLKQLKPEEGMILVETLTRLGEIQIAIAPFSLDLNNPASARVLIKAFEGMDEHEIRRRVSAVFE